MCILLITTHSCRHTLHSATPCGSKSLACDSTFESRTLYYSCEDCQFNLALALKAKHDSIDRHRRPKATRGVQEDSLNTSISDSRAGDFASALRLGSQEPSIGWDNLERTRAHYEEVEILERVDPHYLADRRASTSSLSSLGSTVSTPCAFADMVPVPQDRRASTSSLSSLGSTVSTPSAFAGPTPDPQNSRPNARKRPRTRSPTPEVEASDSSSEDDDPPPASCTRHASRPTSYQASRCSECAGICDGTAVHHSRPADVPEEIMRADMKNMPTWKGWVPVAKVPAGEFQRLPRFDRRGMVVVDRTDALL